MESGCRATGGLPPRLFGRLPVIYMNADPALYGGRGMRVGYDDAAIAQAAFRELSAGLSAVSGVEDAVAVTKEGGQPRGIVLPRRHSHALRHAVAPAEYLADWIRHCS